MIPNDYFSINALSASKIGELKRVMAGENAQINAKEETLLFGTVFHAIMAGEDIEKKFDQLKPSQRFEVMKMSQKIHKELGHILQKAIAKEKEYFWEQEIDGIGRVKCKAKADLVFKDDNGDLHCVDFKTTTAADYNEFAASILAYDYHRQAAWYFNADNFQSFIIVGISKNKSHDIFVLPPFTKEDAIIEAGWQDCIDTIHRAKQCQIISKYLM